MREEKIEIGYDIYLGKTIYSDGTQELTLDYVEHCPVVDGSDTDTSIAISKAKAKEMVVFLKSFIESCTDERMCVGCFTGQGCDKVKV